MNHIKNKEQRSRDLVVFLFCQQVVEGFVDGLVVVILDRPQVRLDQLQLVHLVMKKTTRVMTCQPWLPLRTKCKEKYRRFGS